jgi:hypothetical protein
MRMTLALDAGLAAFLKKHRERLKFGAQAPTIRR